MCSSFKPHQRRADPPALAGRGNGQSPPAQMCDGARTGPAHAAEGHRCPTHPRFPPSQGCANWAHTERPLLLQILRAGFHRRHRIFALSFGRQNNGIDLASECGRCNVAHLDSLQCYQPIHNRQTTSLLSLQNLLCLCPVLGYPYAEAPIGQHDLKYASKYQIVSAMRALTSQAPMGHKASLSLASLHIQDWLLITFWPRLLATRETPLRLCKVDLLELLAKLPPEWPLHRVSMFAQGAGPSGDSSAICSQSQYRRRGF
jgi:hypothetical protein